MEPDSKHRDAVAYLQRDAFRHIALLKMLGLYGQAMQSHHLCSQNGEGVLLLLPTNQSPFDRQNYGHCCYAVLLSATSQAVVESLLDLLPRDADMVFKLLDDADRQTVRRRFPLRRTFAVISFGSPPGLCVSPEAAVQVTCHVDPDSYELFAGQGHSREEVDAHFAANDARCLVLRADGIAACACFTFQNYAHIYEVCSVFTHPAFRRRGLARRVVQTALHDLLSRGLIPRYQVHEQNTASIALAYDIGLCSFVTVEHWVTAPASNSR